MGPSPLGGPCALASDCLEGTCTEASATCLARCQATSECGEGQGCVPATEVDEMGRSVAAALCFPVAGSLREGAPCGDANQCASGICIDDRCAELCSDTCEGRALCEPRTFRTAAGALVAGACRVDLSRPDLIVGPFEVDAEGTTAAMVPIPPGVRAFTAVVIQDASRGTDWVGIRRLRAPDGTVLVDTDDDAPDPNPASNFYLGSSAVLVPSTDDPAFAPMPGTYLLVPGIYEVDRMADDPFPSRAGTIDRIEVRFHYEGVDARRVDLNLFFTPNTDLDAATAAEDEVAQEILTTAIGAFADAGLELGEVAYFDLPAERDRVTSSSEARAICEEYSEPGPNGISVNIFMVSQLTFAQGFTGGRPVGAGLAGQPASGIVLQRLPSARETGLLVAHELAHFLGLEHTTNMQIQDGRVEDATPDAISDTPACESGTALSDCPDADNLMFPVVPTSTARLTPGQVQVLLGSPSLYAP